VTSAVGWLVSTSDISSCPTSIGPAFIPWAAMKSPRVLKSAAGATPSTTAKLCDSCEGLAISDPPLVAEQLPGTSWAMPETAPITLDTNQSWYTGQHYLSINLHAGIDINTVVYHLTS
jgi:hypothetical protein